ncbi:prepilin-type N-terminal cleavage/methylation domain-containing protein [Candidatus Sumerlaeota bacterium]|nr:prepilin-type N-terminal cleavage/methylation domain-containing protein [Candidatus Sumerlaeota bacterium]
MQKVKGFTLIELLIVVAIIAILAAIAVPNFLEAQVRSKVSRAKSDLRTISTGLEAYYVDNNSYVGSGSYDRRTDQNINSLTVNDGHASKPYARNRVTFRRYGANSSVAVERLGTLYNTLTTPVSFVSSIPTDPFASTKGSYYGFWNADNVGWIMWSYGPNADETWSGTGTTINMGGEIETFLRGQTAASNAYVFEGDGANSVYNPYRNNPTTTLWVNGYTYDASNGTTSAGDVWRIRE